MTARSRTQRVLGKVTQSREYAVGLRIPAILSPRELPPEQLVGDRSPDGGPTRRYQPQQPNGTGILWLHGGGLVTGTVESDDRLCRLLAERTGAVVASVDYRLAPEHPYPAALDDAYAALLELADDCDRVALGGASAGGGLAAALAVRARDGGELKPVFQALVYPMLDDRTVGAQHQDPRHRLWSAASNEFGWRSYQGPGAARTGDLRGLPPAWIGVGSLDLFHAECTVYAERLRAAGVSCELDLVRGAPHGFDRMAPWSRLSRNFLDRLGSALRTGLA